MSCLLVDRRASVLGLAAAASLLELGPIAALLNRNESILAVLAAGLAYQIGNAMPRPAALHGRLTSAVAAVLGAALLLFAPVASLPWLLAIAALSWTLQAVRRNITGRAGNNLPTTAQKRGARVVGFVVAALVPIYAWLALVLLVIALALPQMQARTDSAHHDRAIIGHRLEWTMLIHQTHYFSYAYAVPVLVARPELGGVALMGFWFACGWITYLSAEKLWARFPPRRVFIGGHLFLTAVLLLLAWTRATPWATASLWILSGLGGGTVYCITLLHKREGLPHAGLERAEDVGHLLGVTLALVCVYFLGWNANSLPAIGSLCAFGAALSMTAFADSRRQDRKSEKRGLQGGTDAS